MLRSQGELRRALAWLLGGATMSGWEPVLAVLPYVLLGLGLLITSGHALNVLQFGDEQAQQLGLPVERTRTLLIVAASLTTAAAVSFSGVIGFIGLIVVFNLRKFARPERSKLTPMITSSVTTIILATPPISIFGK